MAYFEIEGKRLLKGDVIPAGNKNEALPVIAASLLVKGDIYLDNIPDIRDVNMLLKIVEDLGAEVERISPHKVKINATNLDKWELDPKLSSAIRASITLIGPLLARLGRVSCPLPGGDRIGRRRIDTHLIIMEKLGADISYEREKEAVNFFVKDGLKGSYIILDEASVTATENGIMAAVLAEGETIIYNAAAEPHVQGLCRFLNSLGAKIEGVGTNLLKIKGVNQLSGGRYSIDYDYIEVGSFMGIAAVTGGEITIKNVFEKENNYIDIAGSGFKKLGLYFERRGKDLFVPGNQKMEIKRDFKGFVPKISDGPWPLFPADLTSVMIVAATQATGNIIIHEKMFESRMFFVDKLIYMGAQLVLCDPHRVVVMGPSPLYATEAVSPDIRAGISLLIAALGAEGVSKIHNILQIDRGYENIDKRLNALGASVKRIEE